MTWGSTLRMDGLAARQHLDELTDPSGSGVASFRRLDRVKRVVAALPGELRERRLCARVGTQRRCEVGRDLDGLPARVRGVPATVSPCALDFGKTGRMHSPLAYEPFDDGYVSLRPTASGA